MKEKIKEYLLKIKNIYKQIQNKKEANNLYNMIDEYISIQIDLIDLIINDKINIKLCLTNLDIFIKNCEIIVEKLKSREVGNSTKEINNNLNIKKINNKNIKEDNIEQKSKNTNIKENILNKK